MVYAILAIALFEIDVFHSGYIPVKTVLTRQKSVMRFKVRGGLF
jgi:hypothetical protein